MKLRNLLLVTAIGGVLGAAPQSSCNLIMKAAGMAKVA